MKKNTLLAVLMALAMSLNALAAEPLAHKRIITKDLLPKVSKSVATGKKLHGADVKKLAKGKLSPVEISNMVGTVVGGYEHVDYGLYSFQMQADFDIKSKMNVTELDAGADYFYYAETSVACDNVLWLSAPSYMLQATYDLNNKTLRQVGEKPEEIFFSATYDGSEDAVYGQFFNEEGNGIELARFDMKTHERITINSNFSESLFVGMAFDALGDLWGIDMFGDLARIDRTTGITEWIGSTGVEPAMYYTFGGVSIDKERHMLFWTFDVLNQSNGELYLATASIDLHDFSLKLVGTSKYMLAGMSLLSGSELADTCIPSSPTGVKLSRNGTTAHLKWNAVTTLRNGTKLQEVEYVVKNNVTGKTATVTGTTYTESGINPKEFTDYSYTVKAVSRGMIGKETQSNIVRFGDCYLLPHNFPVDLGRDIPEFTIIDNNHDGITWEFGETTRSLIVVGSAEEHDNDDWLILPALHLSGSAANRVTWQMRSVASNHIERFELAVGKGTKVSDMTTIVIEPTDINHESYKTYVADIMVPEDGNYNIGLHSLSRDGYYMYVDSINVVSGVSKNAPAQPTQLTVTAAEKGMPSAEVSFVAPTKTLVGSATTLLKAEVWRDEKLVATFDHPTPGEKLTCTDTDVPNGWNEYTVLAYNESGRGDVATMRCFVGCDIPLPPKNVKLSSTEAGFLMMTWDPVSEKGENGQYVNPDDVSYRIYIEGNSESEGDRLYRYTDPGMTQYIFFDTNVNTDDQRMLHLAVSSYDDVRERESYRKTWSDFMLVGAPYELPYDDDLTVNSPFDWYELEPAVGSSTEGWQYGVDMGEGLQYVKCGYPTSEAQVMTGKIKIGGTHHPTLVFDYYRGEQAFYDEMVVEASVGSTSDFKPVLKLNRDNRPESKWTLESASLDGLATSDDDWVCLRFWAYGAPAGVPARDYQMFKHVKVIEAEDNELALSIDAAPETLAFNGEARICVSVTNKGGKAIAPNDYTVQMKKGDKVVATAETRELGAFATLSYVLRYACVGPLEDDNLKLSIVASCGENKAEQCVELALVRPILPQVKNLTATPRDDSSVKLTWQLPEEMAYIIEEGFEDYEAFAVGDEILTEKGYTVDFIPQATDHCGSGTYPHASEPIGWLVFDNAKAGFGGSGAYAPHSGSQCLVAFDGEEKMDTWLITPQLSGKPQTISFWTGALTGNWGAEEFNVLYSVSGKSKSDFIQINDKVLTEKDSWAWNYREFNVPEGAKFFAIQVVSTNKMGFKVDDLKFEAGSGKLDVNVEGYNVYANGKLCGTTTEQSYTDTNSAEEYGVSICTDWGEGEPVAVKVDYSDINGISIDEDNAPRYTPKGTLATKSERGIVVSKGQKRIWRK